LSEPILSQNISYSEPSATQTSTHSHQTAFKQAGMQYEPQLQSKDWIRDKIQNLRRQSGIAFNQDLFISILLCLISGPGRHLILTASEDQLPNVTSMTNKVCISEKMTDLACRERVEN
jgi:hypothetical protein